MCPFDPWVRSMEVGVESDKALPGPSTQKKHTTNFVAIGETVLGNITTDEWMDRQKQVLKQPQYSYFFFQTGEDNLKRHVFLGEINISVYPN